MAEQIDAEETALELQFGNDVAIDDGKDVLGDVAGRHLGGDRWAGDRMEFAQEDAFEGDVV